MCAKLGEFVRIIKAKSLIAKDFFRGEAFCNLLLKEFIHGSGCRISVIHLLCHSLVRSVHYSTLLHCYPGHREGIFSNYRTPASAICYEFRRENFHIFFYSCLCEIKLINFNSCESSTALLSFFLLSVCLLI